MSDYLVHGKKGNGKSLICVGKIRDALLAGKPVATNLDLHLDKLLPSGVRKVTCYRLPDRPSIDDMRAIGRGSDEVDESTYGLIVLDEMATWMNARNFSDKARQPLLDWFVHSRKLGWDVFFIAQNPSQIDKQVRESLIELSVSCKRLDKIRVPFIGSFSKMLTGYEVRPPKVHVATVRYGTANESVVNDRWYYKGADLYEGYDTRQIFREDYADGLYSYLSPWHTMGRYLPPKLSTWEQVFPVLTFPFAVFAWLLTRLDRECNEIISGAFRHRPQSAPVAVQSGPSLPKHVLDLLRKLPPDQRIKHFHRLSDLAAVKSS